MKRPPISQLRGEPDRVPRRRPAVLVSSLSAASPLALVGLAFMLYGERFLAWLDTRTAGRP